MMPPMDQAAHALVIRRGTLAPEKLPIDSAADRSRINSVQAELNQAGTLQSRVTVMHTGVEAWEIRGTYRYLTAEKRATTMQAKIAQEYPDVSIDSLSFAGLDSLSDSLIMNYSFTAKNTVTLSGTTAIFSFHLPDALSPSNYPVEEKRWTPLDFSMSFLSANTQSQRADLTFPEGWKPINLPDPVTLNSPYGSYSLTFSRQGRTISCDRHAVFSLNRQLPVAAYGAVKEFLNAVAKADAVQLVFFTK